MKNKIVEVPSIAEPIKRSPGFEKKDLATYKLDLMALCGFGCRYCSSNEGNYLRINRERFAVETQRQLGLRVLPHEDPSLMMVWPDVLEKLEAQLAPKPTTWGTGHTLVFSMLTDGFSPWLVEHGVTRRALDLVLAKTSFRVRVLTKNAVVGSTPWIDFFRAHPGRFVVGLSCGTLDDKWARQVELGTSPPSERLDALRTLQDAGVPTFGMLCPVFPDAFVDGRLDALLDRVRPELCETIWAEPFNDRGNWRAVRDGFTSDSFGHWWLTEVYEGREPGIWSQYTTSLYLLLRRHAERGGWLPKLKFLLYEEMITRADGPRFGDRAGVLLQSAKDEQGRSRNPVFAEVSS